MIALELRAAPSTFNQAKVAPVLHTQLSPATPFSTGVSSGQGQGGVPIGVNAPLLHHGGCRRDLSSRYSPRICTGFFPKSILPRLSQTVNLYVPSYLQCLFVYVCRLEVGTRLSSSIFMKLSLYWMEPQWERKGAAGCGLWLASPCRGVPSSTPRSPGTLNADPAFQVTILY